MMRLILRKLDVPDADIDGAAETLRILRAKLRKRGVVETAKRVAEYYLTLDEDRAALIERRKLEDADILGGAS